METPAIMGGVAMAMAMASTGAGGPGDGGDAFLTPVQLTVHLADAGVAPDDHGGDEDEDADDDSSPSLQNAASGNGKRKALRTDASGQPLPKRRYTFLDPPLITRAELLVKEQHWGVAAAARHLKVSAGTLYKHFQRAQIVRPPSTKRKGRPQVLTPEDEARVREWAERDSKLSYTKLAALVSSNLNKTVSPGTIGRVLKENLPPEPEAIEKFVECMHMAKKKLDVCSSLVGIPEITDAVVAIHKARDVVVRVLADSQETWEQSPEFQPLKDAGIAPHFVRPPTTGAQDTMFVLIDKHIRVTLQPARRRRQTQTSTASTASEMSSVE